MRKLINDPDDVVDEMIDGMIDAHDGLRRVGDTGVVTRSDAPVSGKVGVVTGGGSGHEPMHAGYVGRGMLDGAAAGAVFTSPPATDFKEMIEACDGGSGVFAVLKNYEGDLMNFDTGADLAETEDVETVVVDDDVSLPDETDRTGRRGVAGTVFVHKVAGAKADRGATLDAVADVARKAVDNVATMGVALSSCVTPGKGEPTFELPSGEMELGIGIHGEPGIERTPIRSADEITQELSEHVLDELELASGDEVAVMVNGLGGTPLGELYIVRRQLGAILRDRDVVVDQSWVGEYCTSLDMRGCSITALRLDEELKSLLNHPVATPGLTVGDRS